MSNPLHFKGEKSEQWWSLYLIVFDLSNDNVYPGFGKKLKSNQVRENFVKSILTSNKPRGMVNQKDVLNITNNYRQIWPPS